MFVICNVPKGFPTIDLTITKKAILRKENKQETNFFSFVVEAIHRKHSCGMRFEHFCFCSNQLQIQG